MKKIIYSPKILGPLNVKQFLTSLFFSLVVAIFWRSLNFNHFIIGFIVVFCIWFYISFVKLKNNIDLAKIDDFFLREQQSIMSPQEYKKFVNYLFNCLKQEIGSIEAKMLSSGGLNVDIGSTDLGQKLSILREKKDWLEKEVEKL